MKTNPALTAYGYQELRRLQQRNMTMAMMIAVSIQLLLVGGYNLRELLTTPDKPTKSVTIRIGDILPPPLVEKPILNVGTVRDFAKLTTGNPVPIPDCDANPEKIYTSPNEIAEIADKDWANIGKSEVIVNEPIKPADEIEPSPNEWLCIEKTPNIVMTSIPEYPDIAKRIGLEGIVYVKVLLDKEGRVKKTLLVKTSDDIFSQPALSAAKKWVFTPALMNGKPVQVWVSIPFRFKLAAR